MKTSLAALLLMVPAITAPAATFVVTNSNDSGPGSLRQAITDVAGTGTVNNQITFNIPGAGVQTIHVLSPLPVVANVTIDGYTQPGAKPNSLAVGTDAILLIEITGNKAQPTGTGFQVGQFSTLRGLVINGFAVDVEVRSFVGLPASVVGCYLETNATGSALIPPAANYSPINANGAGLAATIGGTTPADRNVIAGPIAFRQSNLGQPYTRGTILGNYIGISADGKSFLAPSAYVGFFSNAQAVITNNVIAGYVMLSGATGAITGNFIGTDALGTTASPGALGLTIFSFTSPGGGGAGSGTVIGNVITSVMSSTAVTLTKTQPTSLKGNWIGVAADGKTPLGNVAAGVDLHDNVNATIGGVNSGDGNVIRFAGPGVGINGIGSPGHNFIEGNSIAGTGGLGIDLGPQGVTPNDAADADGIQNYPALTLVFFGNGNVRVKGTLNSTPNTSFRTEFFGNDAGDPSGFGQGQYYLGFANVTTDSNGHASFDVTLPVPASVHAISATATGPNGTSEFGQKAAQFKNISTRARVEGSGDHVAIAGFIVEGPSLTVGEVPHVLVLRAIGPSLTGMPTPLPDPTLEFRFAQVLSASNDNWRDGSGATFIQGIGLAPTSDLESALVGYVGGGAYTAVVRDTKGRAGTAVVEVYDVDSAPGRQLLNISTRGFIGNGDDAMIAGTILEQGAGLTQIVARAIGPSLAAAGIADPLADPTLELHDSQGAMIAFNDNWRDGDAATLSAFGLAPSNDKESAVIASLRPGSAYTAVVRGKDGGTGVALVELYNLH